MPVAVAEIVRVVERGGRLCLAIVHPLSFAVSFQSKREATVVEMHPVGVQDARARLIDELS